MSAASPPVVLITGAASGLGWALAQQWFRQGASLVLVDIDKALLEQRLDTLDASGRVSGVCADVTRTEDIARIAAQAEARGRLDVLVNNAGITHRSPAIRTDLAVFRRVMAVDWQGPVELTMACMPLLLASRGSIVCIGSMAGWMPVPGRAAYCAAKGALGQFFEVLRLELEPHGVHVLMAYPSFLDTPIEHHALGADGRPATHARSMVGRPRSADWMAERIVLALAQRRRWLLPEPVSRFGSLLWRIWPSVYLRAVRRRFANEIARG